MEDSGLFFGTRGDGFVTKLNEEASGGASCEGITCSIKGKIGGDMKRVVKKKPKSLTRRGFDVV